MTVTPEDKEARVLEEAKRHIEADSERLLNNDFQPTLTFYTDDSEVPRLLVMPEMDGTDKMRAQIRWSLSILSASIDNLDCIAFSVDTYAHKIRLDDNGELIGPYVEDEDGHKMPAKIDGSRWDHGDMQYAWVNDTPDKANLTEAYTYQIAYADGTFAMLSVPYVKDEDAGTIDFDWSDVKPLVTGQGEGEKVGGFFPNAMFYGLTQTKMIDAMKEHFNGLDPTQFGLEEWQARLHTMAVAVKMILKETGWPCMIPGRSEEEAAVIKDSFEGGPFTENIRALDQDQMEEIVTLEEQFDKPAVGTPEWLAGMQGSVE